MKSAQREGPTWDSIWITFSARFHSAVLMIVAANLTVMGCVKGSLPSSDKRYGSERVINAAFA